MVKKHIQKPNADDPEGSVQEYVVAVTVDLRAIDGSKVHKDKSQAKKIITRLVNWLNPVEVMLPLFRENECEKKVSTHPSHSSDHGRVM